MADANGWMIYEGVVVNGQIILNPDVVLPEGETVVVRVATITVRIEREGRDIGEGVGYLADGSIVSVYGAKNLVGQEVKARIEEVLETSDGNRVIISHVEGSDF